MNKLLKLSLFGALIFAPASMYAGYSVHTHVQGANGKFHYTWTVHNEDQSWGLDAFVIEVPEETKVLGYTVPPPYSSADGTGYWIMEERREQSIDPHNGEQIYPAPKPGWKWLAWWGHQSPSVYPPGTSATFKLTTDSSVQPGSANSFAITYTPQNNPSYYRSWNGSVTGPVLVRNVGSQTTNLFDGFQSYSAFEQRALDDQRRIGQTAHTNHQGLVAVSVPVVSVNLHAGISIQGDVGNTYAIHSSDDLTKDGDWLKLGSLTLNAKHEIWFDPRPASQKQRFYRVIPELAP